MICVDASVAMKWLFAEEHSVQARMLLRASVTTGERMIAPPLLPSEVTNAIRQRLRRGQVLLNDARDALSRFLAMPVELLTPEALYERAFTLAVDLGLPATYDAQYVALSEMVGATFWTADVRLYRASASRIPLTHWDR